MLRGRSRPFLAGSGTAVKNKQNFNKKYWKFFLVFWNFCIFCCSSRSRSWSRWRQNGETRSRRSKEGGGSAKLVKYHTVQLKWRSAYDNVEFGQVGFLLLHQLRVGGGLDDEAHDVLLDPLALAARQNLHHSNRLYSFYYSLKPKATCLTVWIREAPDTYPADPDLRPDIIFISGVQPNTTSRISGQKWN